MKQYVLDIEEETTGAPYPQEIKPDIEEAQLNQYSTTTGAPEVETPIVVLSISRIVSRLSEEFQNIKDPQMRDLFFKLFQSFQDHLLKYSSQKKETSHFPQVSIKMIEDGSILIEWIFIYFRIGFSIEPEINQSSWYLLSNEKLENKTESGFFNIENIDAIIDDLFYFIFRNT